MHIVIFGDNATSLSVARCLKGHRITVVSKSSEPRLASLSRFVHGRIRLVEKDLWQMFERVSLLRERVDERLLLFPCSDEWIEILSADMSRMLEIGFLLPSTSEHLSLTTDKAAFADAISKYELPRPAILNPHVVPGWVPPAYPFVLKPSSTYRLEAQLGVKAVVIRRPEEWTAIDKSLLDRYVFLAQEYLEGASISVCFCTTPNGRVATSYATEKVHAGEMRTGSRVVTVDRPDAIELAAHFVDRTGFVGFGELEMIDSHRGLVLLELNARPWSQVLMADAVGAPILELAIKLMLGQEIPMCSTRSTTPVEWIFWDKDLIYRRALRRNGRGIRPPISSKRVYPQSFLRDPIPALIHALTQSPLRPWRSLSRG